MSSSKFMPPSPSGRSPYSGLFGWRFERFAGPQEYWLVTTGPADQPGINGGLLRRMGPNPPPAEPTPVVGWVCTVDVPDLDKTVADALAAGAIVALPKQAIPVLAWLAYLKDTESNIFGVYQIDSSAA